MTARDLISAVTTCICITIVVLTVCLVILEAVELI